MKRLAIEVGAITLGILVLVGVLAAVIVRQNERPGALAVLRDISVMILALLPLICAIIMAVVLFGAAWGVGRYGAKGVAGLHWVGGKVAHAETLVWNGLERYVARPLATVQRTVRTGTALANRLLVVPPALRRIPEEAAMTVAEARAWRDAAAAGPSAPASSARPATVAPERPLEVAAGSVRAGANRYGAPCL